LTRELSVLYAQECGRRPETLSTAPLPMLPMQYADYALWQREQLQGAVLTEQLAYWQKQLALMPDFATLPPQVHFSLAIIFSRLGETDEALHHVERMVDHHLGACVFLGVDPALAPLQSHPRYQAVLKRIGVGPQQMASTAHTAST